NCGGCNAVCSPNHVAARTCSGGQCNGACAAGFSDCNGDKLNDGCETATGTDVANCGSCGHACSAAHGVPTCMNGVCQISCSPGFGDCDNDAATGCETPFNTNGNCGGCGIQ